jgi:putative two-component system response regulator
MRPILIVLNVQETRSRFAKTLSQAGYEVAEADSSESALRLASSLQPHLVLMGIVMPGLNGLQTAARLRKLLSPDSVDIIVVGSLPPLGLDQEPLASLVNGYLSSDVPPDELLKYVHKHVNEIVEN